MRKKLVDIEKLYEMLGFTDYRSVEKWCKKHKIPIIIMGKRQYIIENFINQFIEDEMRTFAENNYSEPDEIMKAIEDDSAIELAKLMNAPITQKVEKKYNTEVKRSKAASNFLNNINVA